MGSGIRLDNASATYSKFHSTIQGGKERAEQNGPLAVPHYTS